MVVQNIGSNKTEISVLNKRIDALEKRTTANYDDLEDAIEQNFWQIGTIPEGNEDVTVDVAEEKESNVKDVLIEIRKKGTIEAPPDVVETERYMKQVLSQRNA